MKKLTLKEAMALPMTHDTHLKCARCDRPYMGVGKCPECEGRSTAGYWHAKGTLVIGDEEER